MTGVEIIMFFTCRCFFMFYKKQSTKAKSEPRNEKELPERMSRKHMNIWMVIVIVTIILFILIVAITLAISFSISENKTTSSITTTNTTTSLLTTTTTTTTGKLANSSTSPVLEELKSNTLILASFTNMRLGKYSTNS
jgi:cytoskeletal protein RodZ